MANEILKSLLKEYEQKRIRAELDLEKRKEELYKQIPRLGEIENNYAISTAKNILNNNSYSLEKFYSHFNELKKEKDEILKKENIDASYLQPQYECNICKDTGYILNSDYKTDMCNCLKQKLLDISFNKSNIYNLNKENFSTFNEKIFSDKVDTAKYKYNN